MIKTAIICVMSLCLSVVCRGQSKTFMPDEIWQDGVSWYSVTGTPGLSHLPVRFIEHRIEGSIEIDNKRFLQVWSGDEFLYGLRLEGSHMMIASGASLPSCTDDVVVFEYTNFDNWESGSISVSKLVLGTGEIESGLQPMLDARKYWIPSHIDDSREWLVMSSSGSPDEWVMDCGFNLAVMNLGYITGFPLIDPFIFPDPIPIGPFEYFTLEFIDKEGVVIFKNPCYDKIMEYMSGVYACESDSEKAVSLYTFNGQKISGCFTSDRIHSLPPGLYIRQVGGKTEKFLVRSIK